MRLDLQPAGHGIGRQRGGAVASGPLLQREQNLAGLRPGILPHHAILRHEIDQPGTAAVADAQGPLQQRHAAAAFADHDFHSRLVHVVAFLRRNALGGIGGRGRLQVDQLRGILRLGGADRSHHPADFVVAEIGALAAEDLAGSRRKEEHVAVAEQPLGTTFVEHHAAVGAAGNLKRDAGRQIALDEAGDHVDRRLLRGQHEMDTDRPALLRQPNDMALDLLAGRHHHVGDLVGNHHDIRHRGGDGGCLFVGLRPHPLEQLVAAELVVLREVPHANAGEHRIAFLHLVDRPGQNRLRLLHVGDDRMHQMR